MSTLVQTLQDKKFLQDLCFGMFLDGECYAFAIALNEGLGWPMVGLMSGKEIRHAAVRRPDGKLHDARGPVSEQQFGHPFCFAPPYDLRTVTAEDLIRAGEPNGPRKFSIDMARRTAEALWPELPWENSLASKVSAFAEELEALSRKHGLWIRSSVPTAASMIAIGLDDEGGYELRPTVDGVTFTIDRYFA